MKYWESIATSLAKAVGVGGYISATGPMGYLIWSRARFWLSMAILVGLFTRLFGGGSACRDRNSARVTGVGVGIRLYKKYSKQYGQQAAALASAVTNELFGAPPANEAGRAGYDPEVL